jgi:hypothetical protein
VCDHKVMCPAGLCLSCYVDGSKIERNPNPVKEGCFIGVVYSKYSMRISKLIQGLLAVF